MAIPQQILLISQDKISITSMVDISADSREIIKARNDRTKKWNY